jgi:hypothetical protein
MKPIFRKLILAGVLFLPVFPAFTQQSGKAADATKRKEKIEREQKKEYNKAREKTIKHRREIQTKETRERMDIVDKRARTNNRKDDPKWWQRIFGKRKRKHP